MNRQTSATSKPTTSVKSEPPVDPFRDLRWISSALGAFSALALLLTWWYGYVLTGWRFQPQTLWAIAIWSAGGGVGFLFAIPRVLQGAPSAAGPATTSTTTPAPSTAMATTATVTTPSGFVYEQRVNTNLEEISDWLTKIIVGITLIQLNQIPDLIWRLSAIVVADLSASQNTSGAQHLGYGTALIVAFSVLGFLFGYLVTRLYLQGALARAERGLSNEGRLELERRAVTAEDTAELLSRVAPARKAKAVAAVEPPEAVKEKLDRLATEYNNVNIADSRLRTSEKNRLAASLFEVVVNEGVSREWLAEQNDDAKILALASTVQAFPESGDAERLLKVAGKSKKKHVRYRLTSAFGKLLESGLVPAGSKPRIRAVIESYLTDADPPLASLGRAVLNQLGPT